MSQGESFPRRIIVGVAIGAALIPLNSTMVAVALPDIGNSLEADAGTLTLWLVTSYLLVNVVLQSPAGKLSDILGRRRAFSIGQAVFGLGALIATFLPYLGTVALARVLMAAGGALLVPTGMALLRTIVSEENRPRAFSNFGALLGASAAVGPLIGGVLTSAFGWKSIFLINVPLLLISGFFVQSQNDAWGDSPRATATRDANAANDASAAAAANMPSPSFDFRGMFLLTVGLASTVIGMKIGGGSALLLLPLGLLSLVAFVWWERRVASPLIDPGLFRKMPFVIGGTVVGLQNLAMYALLFQLPFLLKDWIGLGTDEVGRTLLCMTLGMVFFAPVGGNLAQRIGTRNNVLTGLTASLLGLLGLLLATTEKNLPGMLVSLGFVGAGIGMVMGPSQAAALSSIDRLQSGVGAGVLSTLRYIGGIAGITVVSVVLTHTDTASLLIQSQICFWIYVGAHVVGPGARWRTTRPNRSATKGHCRLDCRSCSY